MHDVEIYYNLIGNCESMNFFWSLFATLFLSYFFKIVGMSQSERYLLCLLVNHHCLQLTKILLELKFENSWNSTNDPCLDHGPVWMTMLLKLTISIFHYLYQFTIFQLSCYMINYWNKFLHSEFSTDIIHIIAYSFLYNVLTSRTSYNICINDDF